MYQISGSLERIGETEIIKASSGSYCVREFILKMEPQAGRADYYLQFSLSGYRAQLLDTFSEGENVHITFHLSGKLCHEGHHARNRLIPLTIEKI